MFIADFVGLDKAQPNLLALKAKADYLVSKDDHLKDLKEYKGIKIVSSQEFLEILTYSL